MFDFQELLLVKPLFAPRRILQPSEKCQYRVLFEPQCPDNYKYAIAIEINNSKSVFNVQCFGKCCIPAINTRPDSIFPKMIATRTEKNAHKSCVFVKSLNVFDFGYIFLQKVDERYK